MARMGHRGEGINTPSPFYINEYVIIRYGKEKEARGHHHFPATANF